MGGLVLPSVGRAHNGRAHNGRARALSGLVRLPGRSRCRRRDGRRDGVGGGAQTAWGNRRLQRPPARGRRLRRPPARGRQRPPCSGGRDSSLRHGPKPGQGCLLVRKERLSERRGGSWGELYRGVHACGERAGNCGGTRCRCFCRACAKSVGPAQRVSCSCLRRRLRRGLLLLRRRLRRRRAGGVLAQLSGDRWGGVRRAAPDPRVPHRRQRVPQPLLLHPILLLIALGLRLLVLPLVAAACESAGVLTAGSLPAEAGSGRRGGGAGPVTKLVVRPEACANGREPCP
mmetsp:Transcript_9612/g.37418  ORF Transcript_9612/g.37418 Transcript_9612/m.37418 type:complete len:287 (-) Transcript_9612:477-1337(-)